MIWWPILVWICVYLWVGYMVAYDDDIKTRLLYAVIWMPLAVFSIWYEKRTKFEREHVIHLKPEKKGGERKKEKDDIYVPDKKKQTKNRQKKKRKGWWR